MTAQINLLIEKLMSLPTCRIKIHTRLFATADGGIATPIINVNTMSIESLVGRGSMPPLIQDIL
jgi:hypothetical protein